MGKDKDSSKNNSKKYKSQVKKDIQKKIKDKADKRRKAYGNVSGGSRVVKHDKSSVNAATPYYTKRVRRGGYGNYAHHYPYQEGVLDKEMAAANYYDKALRQHKNANQFHTLVTGLAAGKFEDLDENRRAAVAKQVIEDERQKRIDEIKLIEKKTKDTDTVTKGKLKELGMDENASDVDISTRHEQARRKLEKKEKMRAKINDLNLALDKVYNVALDTEGAADNLRQKFGDHPRIRPIVADLDKVSPEMVDEVYKDVQKELKEIEPQLKKYYAINARLTELINAHQKINKMEEEFAAMGRENPELAGVLAKKQAVYGDPQQRFEEMEKAIKAKEETYIDFFEFGLPKLQKRFKRFQAASGEYIQARNDMREQAIEILLDSEALDPEEREQLTHAPHTVSDHDLAVKMETKAPLFERGKADIQRNYQHYADRLRRFKDPELARAWNIDNHYLRHIQKFSDLYDTITTNIARGIPMEQSQIDDEILGITKKLLRNPRFNDNVEYGPKLETAMPVTVDRPEDLYSYARENTPVDLIMSDTTVPVDRASQEPNLETSDSHGYAQDSTPVLEVSDRTSLEKTDPVYHYWTLESPSLEPYPVKVYQDGETNEWVRTQKLRHINKGLEAMGKDPITKDEMDERVEFYNTRMAPRWAAQSAPMKSRSSQTVTRIMEGEIF